jgi:hypothetical protein
MNLFNVRVERVKMLNATDWTQASDSPLSDSDKVLWAEYRQELRDITNNPESFFDDDGLFWPIPPWKYDYGNGETPNLACMSQ